VVVVHQQIAAHRPSHHAASEPDSISAREA